MKKISSNAVRMACFFVLLIGVAFYVIFRLWSDGVFVSDHSAEYTGSKLTWDGKTYSASAGDYTEGRIIAKTEDGWDIHEVKEDPDHHFLVVRSFLDQQLFVSDDYTVPESGNLTTASWNGTYITDPDFLKAISEIQAQKNTSFMYATEGITSYTDDQRMRSLYVAYENCPVATIFAGYLGKVNDRWVITTEIEQVPYPQPYTVGCYVIPNEYVSLLEEYFDGS